MNCAECGKHIPDGIVKRRHYTQLELQKDHHFCDQDCLAIWRSKNGFFEEMSKAGKGQRRVALEKSNRENPRRKPAREKQ